MGDVVGGIDPALQMRQCLSKNETALEGAGASLRDVAPTRIYVTDIKQCERIGRVHAEFFGETRPATTLLEVSRLISSELLVEVEAEAWQATVRDGNSIAVKNGN